MTEAEWLEASNPEPMLESLREKASSRKLRLFAVGCCRGIWHRLNDERSRNAVEAAERSTEEEIVGRALEPMRQQAIAATLAVRERTSAHYACTAAGCVLNVSSIWKIANSAAYIAALGAARQASVAVKVGTRRGGGGGPAAKRERNRQASMLRCIFGNPFRPVTVSPAWQTANVLALAQGMYDDRGFDRMPILGDALEEAGCTNAEVLSHCREPGKHVRGCWVVDLLIGKE
jgi:hypothetical protein